MTSAMERLEGILSGADGERAIVDWYHHPVTMDMLSACRELGLPRRPHGDEAHLGWLALGESLGANRIVDFLTNPVGYLKNLRSTGKMPAANYGAARIRKINEEGQ